MRKPKSTRRNSRRSTRPSRHGRSQPAPLMQSEPKLPFRKQHQPQPGLESKLQPLPRWQAARYRAAGKLEGKVALITGGDSGIGRAVAFLFAREGADVAINYLPAEKVAEFGRQSPLGRPAQPEELAAAYVFLASDADSSYITGIVLPVMGGDTTGG